MSEDIERPFTEHLEELRSRIIKSLVIFLIAAFSLIPFSGRIFPLILIPFRRAVSSPMQSDPRIIFTAPTEAFLTHMNICIYGGLLITSPFILYQIWAFVSIALKDNEKRAVVRYFLVSVLLFLLGALFGFTVIVPLGLQFLLGFGGQYMTAMITIGKYISFMAMLTFAFGIVFQLPLAMVFTVKTGITTPEIIASKRRGVIVAIFIVAALLTPPDVITQCLMAVPLIALFEIGLVCSRIFYRKGK